MSSHNSLRENHDSSASGSEQNSLLAFGLPPEEIDYESLPSNASFSSHLVAGALAGITEHSITYPFDTIKTRMQSFDSPNPATRLGQVYRQISQEGRLKFFRGVASVVLGAGPAHALYFATYEQAKKAFVKPDSSYRHLGASLSGAIATVVHDTFMTPFDVVKQRMQVKSSTYRNIYQCAKQTIQAEGFSALYVSYFTTLLLNIPFQAIQFPVYEASSRLLNPEGKYDALSHMLAGAASGSCAAALTTPLDCVKTVLQTRGTALDPAMRQVNGFVDGVRLLYANRGLIGFFRGIQPRIFAQMPATALCWTTYEYFKLVLGLRADQNE